MNLEYWFEIRPSTCTFAISESKYVSKTLGLLRIFQLLCFVMAKRPAIFLLERRSRPSVEKMAASRGGMKPKNPLCMQSHCA